MTAACLELRRLSDEAGKQQPLASTRREQPALAIPRMLYGLLCSSRAPRWLILKSDLFAPSIVLSIIYLPPSLFHLQRPDTSSTSPRTGFASGTGSFWLCSNTCCSGQGSRRSWGLPGWGEGSGEGLV